MAKNGVTRFLRRHLLLLLIILAMIVGICLGIGLRYVDPKLDKRQLMYLKYPGDILMRMLKMLVLPLIFTSLTTGLATLDAKASGKLGGRAILYYMSTTLIAVILGIVLVVSIKPGSGNKEVDRAGKAKISHPADAFLDLIRNLFPANIIEACFKNTITTYAAPTTECCKCCNTKEDEKNTTEIHLLNKTGVTESMTATVTNATTVISTKAPKSNTEPDYNKFSVGMQDGTNVLGILLFAIVFGAIISRIEPKHGAVLISFFVSLNDAVMKMVALVIWYSPIGILFLVAEKIVAMEDVAKVISQLGLYSITVMAGLAIHGFIILPLIYFAFIRKNPFSFMLGVLQALVTAIGTASSSATLPVTMKCLEENNGIDKRVTRFVLPIGATINMDGTALYEAIAAIFIAQMNNIDLSFGQIIAVSITATAASVGAAGVPQAGLVTMVIVLSAVGLPLDDVTLIIAIDWFLDRFRTAVNVWGDSVGAGIIHHYTNDDLAKLDHWDDETMELNDTVEYKKQNQNGTASNYGYIESSTSVTSDVTKL